MAFNFEKCPATFGFLHHLERHVDAKHSDMRFQCNVCKFITNRKDNLNRHKKSKYSESTLKNANEVDEIVNFIEGNPSNKIPPIESEKSKLLPTYFDWVEEVENEEALQQGRKIKS